MLQIPAIYSHAEQLIAGGADDAQLRAGIAKMLGVDP
jgi:hypothetical protein